MARAIFASSLAFASWTTYTLRPLTRLHEAMNAPGFCLLKLCTIDCDWTLIANINTADINSDRLWQVHAFFAFFFDTSRAPRNIARKVCAPKREVAGTRHTSSDF